MFIYMIMFYIFICVIISFFIFLYFLMHKIVFYLEFNLVHYMSLKFELIILIDWMSLLFMNVVLTISLMVFIYSMEYMEGEKNMKRFSTLLSLFVLSMMLLIFSPNMISILLGWDGLGLVSYCLVIYYQSKNSFNSGMVTVLTNRLGDILILMVISMMMSMGSWNFMYLGEDLDNMILLMLIIASFTKSAQVPFSAWLPMAMAAPTPVSALVHSSTLVTAGVYLIIRVDYLIVDKYLLNMMLLVSVITMFLAGLCANYEYDLKKIIALSTLSQLGVMFFSLSLKMEEITMFHLLMHAMFKSMLFMCAGVIIHSMGGNQDIRYMGMVSLNLPLVSIMFNCATLSLCGIPFMSGFFSKDLILEMFMMNKFNKFILMILFTSMGLTVSYSFRLIYFTFILIPRGNIFVSYLSMSSNMVVSMYLLFIYSITMGLIMNWFLFTDKNMIILSSDLKLLIFDFMLLGLCLGIFIMMILPPLMYFFSNASFIKFFNKLWFMASFYGAWIWNIFSFAMSLYFFIDSGWLEMILSSAVMYLIKKILKSELVRKNYFLMLIIISVIILLIICL